MGTHLKRTMVTLHPEWEDELNHLKKEHFYNETKSEMFRYIISRGLEALRKEKMLNQINTTKGRK